MPASSSGSKIEEEVIHDEDDGSDGSSASVRDAVTRDSPSAETRSGGESPTGGFARGHSETCSDDFGSVDNTNDDGEFLEETVDDAPESPVVDVPSHTGAFTSRTSPSAPVIPTQEVPGPPVSPPLRARGATAAAPARAADGAIQDFGTSGTASDIDEIKLFRWERSPSPSPEDVAEERLRRDEAFSRDAKARADPKWASVPGRITALLERARVISERRELVKRMSPAERAQRRYDRDTVPVTVGPLTMAKARASNASEKQRSEAAAIRAAVAELAAAQRRRMTPELARAAYIRRAITRAAAADGARAVSEIDSESEAAEADAARDGKTQSTLSVVEAAGSKSKRSGSGSVSRGFDETYETHETPRPVFGAYPPLGKGRHAVLRRLWASHGLRSAAAETLEGDDFGKPFAPPPKAWTELHLGAAANDAGEWYDEAKGDFVGGAFEEAGVSATTMLRNSAELRRRAGDVLAVQRLR